MKGVRCFLGIWWKCEIEPSVSRTLTTPQPIPLANPTMQMVKSTGVKTVSCRPKIRQLKSHLPASPARTHPLEEREKSPQNYDNAATATTIPCKTFWKDTTVDGLQSCQDVPYNQEKCTPHITGWQRLSYHHTKAITVSESQGRELESQNPHFLLTHVDSSHKCQGLHCDLGMNMKN